MLLLCVLLSRLGIILVANHFARCFVAHALPPGTAIEGRASEVWVFGGLNSSDMNCMMDDLWHASVTFNTSTDKFTLHWEEIKLPPTSIRPSARGIAQSWLQYEHVNDFTDGNWIHFEKTTLFVVKCRLRYLTTGASRHHTKLVSVS